MKTEICPSGNTKHDSSPSAGQTFGKNRLAKVTLPDSSAVTYAYDYQNRLVSRTQGSETRTSLFGSGNQIQEEIRIGQRFALYGWGVDGLASRMDANGQTLFYLKDALGSVLASVDGRGTIAQSYEYSAFGECLSGNDSVNSYRYVGAFGGYTDDTTDLVYFWNRWFDPRAGRWVSEDPIGIEGGINKYEYVLNSPALRIDPNGLVSCTYSISAHTLVCKSDCSISRKVDDTITIGPEGIHSGKGDCKNNPSWACQSQIFSGRDNMGPIPEGLYEIGKHSHPGYWNLSARRFTFNLLNPFSLMRTSFLLHPGSYSYGCITVENDNPEAMSRYRLLNERLTSESGVKQALEVSR